MRNVGGGGLGCRWMTGTHHCAVRACAADAASLYQITGASQHGPLTRLLTHLICIEDNGILVYKNFFSYSKFSETR